MVFSLKISPDRHLAFFPFHQSSVRLAQVVASFSGKRKSVPGSSSTTWKCRDDTWAVHPVGWIRKTAELLAVAGTHCHQVSAVSLSASAKLALGSGDRQSVRCPWAKCRISRNPLFLLFKQWGVKLPGTLLWQPDGVKPLPILRLDAGEYATLLPHRRLLQVTPCCGEICFSEISQERNDV